jgi:hypothetical protein
VAYGKRTHEEAEIALEALKSGLNQSALSRLEETLTLHRLGLMPMLKDSFRTTNCIGNVNSLRPSHPQRATLDRLIPASPL